MFISLIIPAHNVEPYIEECINSILTQNFDDFEIIVVENGSTDKTFELCEKYREHSKIKLFSLHETGVSNARNFGLEKAEGDYVWFVDGDDFILSDGLNILIEEIKSFISNNFFYPDIVIFEYNENSHHKNNYAYIPQINLIDKIEAINGLYMHDKWSGFVWNKIYKRDAICVRFNNEVHMAEDLLWNTQMFFNVENIVYLTNSLYHYRTNPNSISTQFSPKKLTSFKAYELLLAILDPCSFPIPVRIIKQAKVDFSRQILSYYYLNDKSHYTKIKRKYKKIILENIKYYNSIRSKIGGYMTIYSPFILKYMQKFISVH